MLSLHEEHASMKSDQPAFTNRLSKETSPYLLQHAHNPVDWYPWGEEAFERARKEDKPILVSIGYSTCHWCHVMERESFENEKVAEYMNDHFINIKVDREERPDVDQIYMDAIQALTGSGGWPLNCFLTPELKPFYGGTYFPPEPRYGRPSWSQLLMGLNDAYHFKKHQIQEQTERLMDYIQKSERHFIGDLLEDVDGSHLFTPLMGNNMYHALQQNFDAEHGGFGAAPKFPSTMPLNFLMEYAHHYKDEKALAHVRLSLEKMIKGGIYDQLGGGFARYAVDNEWLAPHFEKMLYDNALLISLLSQMQMNEPSDLYEKAIRETMEWVEREMTHSDGSFYSALDADSEGEEGKFYVWDKHEIKSILGDDALIFNAYYDVSKDGNWEGKNILRRITTTEQLAMKIGWEEKELSHLLSKWKTRLFLEREKRIRPGLDDKVLLDWNALMCTACCHAFKALGDEKYKEMAIRNVSFIYKELKNGDGFHHTFKDGVAKYEAYLNGYAYLIEALIELYQITLGECYLHEAQRLTDFALEHFKDEDTDLFYFTREGQDDLIVRKREVFDNALPSANATMVHNLQLLSVIFGEEKYRELARKALLSMYESLEKYPQSFSKWCSAALNEVVGIREVALVGEEAKAMSTLINGKYIPNKIVMASLNNSEVFPLLKDRAVGSETMIYLCSNFICQRPVSTIPEFMELIS